VERPIRQGTFLRQWRALVVPPVAVATTLVIVVAATTGSATIAAAPGVTPVPIEQSSSVKTVLLLGDSTATTLGVGLSLGEKRYGSRIIDKGVLGCGVAEMTQVVRRGMDAAVAPACNPSTPLSGQWPSLWAGWTTIDDVTVRATDGVHFPFFSTTSPHAPDPDTKAQVQHFAAWVGPRLWPRILTSVSTRG
jgi:hypothetical protein